MGEYGICGNGLCEIGEQKPVGGAPSKAHCPWDCLELRKCPEGTHEQTAQLALTEISIESFEWRGACSGHGRCIAATGSCSCHIAYTGDDCGSCMPGYVKQNGACLVAERLLDKTNTLAILGVSSTSEGVQVSEQTRTPMSTLVSSPPLPSRLHLLSPPPITL